MAVANGVIKLTVLGSGTSVGVPTIGCDCEVCTSPDPRDKRLRPSILVRYNGRCVLIDSGPDFRQQALRARIERIDAILFTHSHADHIMGLDDVRPYNFHQKEPIPIYGSAETLAVIQRIFEYVFDSTESQSSRPKIVPHVITDKPVHLFGVDFSPIPLFHGRGHSLGFSFGGGAYLTDHSEIPDSSKAKLRSLDFLFLDALRHKPHPTHSTVERSLEIVQELQPKRAFFTHICHDLAHEKEEQFLPPHVRLAYDGLEISVEPHIASSV